MINFWHLGKVIYVSSLQSSVLTFIKLYLSILFNMLYLSTSILILISIKTPIWGYGNSVNFFSKEWNLHYSICDSGYVFSTNKDNHLRDILSCTFYINYTVTIWDSFNSETNTCCCWRTSRRILFAAFLLSLSHAVANMFSATAEVRCEGMGRD